MVTYPHPKSYSPRGKLNSAKSAFLITCRLSKEPSSSSVPPRVELQQTFSSVSCTSEIMASGLQRQYPFFLLQTDTELDFVWDKFDYFFIPFYPESLQRYYKLPVVVSPPNITFFLKAWQLGWVLQNTPPVARFPPLSQCPKQFSTHTLIHTSLLFMDKVTSLIKVRWC